MHLNMEVYLKSEIVSIEDAYKQVGNSVCIPVIKRIAEKIKEVVHDG